LLLTTYPLISSYKHNGDDTLQSVILPFSLKLEAVDNLRLLLTEVPQMQAIIGRGGDQRALV